MFNSTNSGPSIPSTREFCFSPTDCANRDVKVHELIWRVGMKLPVRCLGRARGREILNPNLNQLRKAPAKPGAFFCRSI